MKAILITVSFTFVLLTIHELHENNYSPCHETYSPISLFFEDNAKIRLKYIVLLIALIFLKLNRNIQ